jgi:hypothetical protein
MSAQHDGNNLDLPESRMSAESPDRKVLSRKFYVEEPSGILYVEELVEFDYGNDLPLGWSRFYRVVKNRPVAPYLVYIFDEQSA